MAEIIKKSISELNFPDNLSYYKEHTWAQVKGEFIQVGVAVTPENSKLIEHVEYEAYAPDGLQALINHALLHKCVPNETTEFNVHYLG